MIDGDKQLIKRAIKGEASAFGLLYDKYQPQIYRFIYLKVGLREEAEDLTHQVFLKSWQNIEDFNFQGFPFSSWLYSVARNQVIDYYRTKKTKVAFDEILEIEGDCDDLSEMLDIAATLEQVKQAILRLGEEQQDVIILRFIEDFSPREVASLLDKTESAVKLLQYRGVKNLKRILCDKIY